LKSLKLINFVHIILKPIMQDEKLEALKKKILETK